MEIIPGAGGRETREEEVLLDDGETQETGDDLEKSGGEAEAEDPVKTEASAKDTAKRVFEELQRAGEEDEEEKAAARENQKGKDSRIIKERPGPAAKTDKADRYDPELQPHNRLKLEHKELFNTLPKGLKRAFNKALTDYQSIASKEQDAAKKLKDRYVEMDEVIEPLRVEWGEMGLSPAQGMRELVAAQKRLTDPKREVREEAFTRMALGCEMGHLLAKKGATTAANASEVDISNHPVVKALESKINSLQGELEPVTMTIKKQTETKNSEIAQANISSMEAIRDEVGRDGKYLRPELHDDDFIDSIGPLVAECMKAKEGRTAGEALAIAWALKTGKPNNLQTTNQTKPLANNSNSIINQRATQAAVTARGKSTPAANTSKEALGDIPPEALKNGAATAAWVHQKLSRGY